MSWSLSKSGKPSEVEAGLETAGEVAKVGRNGFEQKAIDLCVAAGIDAMKHASIDADKTGGVSASGHHSEDGTGGFQLSVSIGQVVKA